MSHSSRRHFLKSGIAAAIAAGVNPISAAPTTKKYATDLVPLGNSGVQVTRLAFGTGTFGGRTQRELGQDYFTKLVRHAYDSGIRFFETAESYHGMPEMLGIALKGIPRDSYRLMSKCTVRPTDDPVAKIDEYRKQLQTEYLDILLLHCVRSPTWPDDMEKHRDAFSEAKQKKIVLAKGASVHGLPALRMFPGNEWLDIAMIRMNHNGTRMDTDATHDENKPGDVNEVVANMKKVHAQGAGIISMKLVGEGRFTNAEDREKAMRFAMNLGVVDTVTLGYKNMAEVDEAIQRMNRVMNA